MRDTGVFYSIPKKRMKTVLRYRWTYVDEISGRQIKTRHHASAADFLRTYPDAKPIPGTEQTLRLPDNPLTHTSAGHVQRGFGDK
jgi:hypothetical protein